MLRRWWTRLVIAACALPACNTISHDEAYDLVERYNRIVSAAYRRADITLIDEVVAPNSRDGKNLTGLIGVRIDAGVTLDATLLDLDVVDRKIEDDTLLIRTRERWSYRDLKVGTGEQLGEESQDSYEILYTFKKHGGRWLVEETEFASPPEVGRKTLPWGMSEKAMHGETRRTVPSMIEELP